MQIDYVPPNQKVLSSVVSPKIKPDGKYIWKFQPHIYENSICITLTMDTWNISGL